MAWYSHGEGWALTTVQDRVEPERKPVKKNSLLAHINRPFPHWRPLIIYGAEQHQVILVCRDNVQKNEEGLQLSGDHGPAS